MEKEKEELEQLTARMNRGINNYLEGLEDEMRSVLGGDLVEKCMKDFKIKELEGIKYMTAMETLHGVLMCIDGYMDYEVSKLGMVRFNQTNK